MYERSAIVLERYFDNIFSFNKQNNLRVNYQNYIDIITEAEEYQKTIVEEESIIKKFDEIAQLIQTIQDSQEKLCKSNEKLENKRNQLFNEFDEKPENIENELEKIESNIDDNNAGLKELRKSYIEALKIFKERQKERNKCEKLRRVAESNYLLYVENAEKIFQKIDVSDVNNLKVFISEEKEEIEKELYDLMIKNGRNERIGFNTDVISKAVKTRISIAEEEARYYVSIYDKTKSFLSEKNNENLKLQKYKKLSRDVSVKLEFLNAEKEYIVGFLDNERITSMNTLKVHNKMMEDACENFDSDIKQINNLYELILRETTNKATKTAYKELYNKTYLKDIEEAEKDFEQEAIKLKISIGTVINSNYWRIEGIKNIYNVFQKEITEKFNKDLSGYKIEENEEIYEDINKEIEDKNDIEEKIDTYIKKYREKNKKIDEQYEQNNKVNEDNADNEDEEEYNEEYDYEEVGENNDIVEENYEEINELKNIQEDFYEEDKKLQKKINKKIEKRIEKENKTRKKNNHENLEYPIENDKVDMIIQNTRQAQIRELKRKQKKGIFGKIF